MSIWLVTCCLLGATQLGLDFDEYSTFWGVECKVKGAAKPKVEQQRSKVDHTVDILHGIWA